MDTNINKTVFVFSFLMGICIGIALALMISFFLCNINPDIESGWLRGVWHGSNFVQNLILSFFDGRLLKAPLHSTAYSVFWWMCSISSVIVWILVIFGWISNFRKKLSEY